MEKWWPLIIVAIVVIIIVILASFIVTNYNKLVKQRNAVKNQFSQIDVQLNRRFDLIPNLVETVKGYASHEEKILSKFAEARTMFQKAHSSSDIKGLANADAAFTAGFNALVNAVKEQYPDLQANQNFQSLMATLKETEDKIAYQRQFYNDVVNKYNNLRELFPSNIVASMFKFEKADFFEATETERENVQVKF